MARKQYHVSPADNMWKVTHSGSTLSRHFAKSAAIAAGVTVARNNQPSQLIIRRADGTIEDERTYGNDPFPPRG